MIKGFDFLAVISTSSVTGIIKPILFMSFKDDSFAFTASMSFDENFLDS